MSGKAGSSESVKVAVRVRPLSSKEIANGNKCIVSIQKNVSPPQVSVLQEENTHNYKTFAFDKVFGQQCTQEEVYNDTGRNIVESVLQGYNGTIFAYGQTGTGKTFTMEGQHNQTHLAGIMPRSFEQIIAFVQKSSGDQNSNIEYLLRASFCEIYQDEVYDLLSKKREKMQVKESKHGGFYVKNLSMFSVKCVKDMVKILRRGQKQRAVGATAMNPGSSRSHCIFTIVVESSLTDEKGMQHFKAGKLNMVDLAGSERQKKTLSKGDRLNEAKAINLSLSALGNVIKALINKNSRHVPFRDSKLTKLLQDSLGGNTKTVMIANIGPADMNLEETMSTLRYANRAKNIQNKPVINEDPKDALIRQMKQELHVLKRQVQYNGSPVKEEKIIKTVEVWHGVSTDKIEQMKKEALREKKRLHDIHSNDKKKLMEEKTKAMKESLVAQQALQCFEEDLRKEEREIESFQMELNAKQSMHKELQETEELLKANSLKNSQMQMELEEMNEEQMYINEQFSSIHQEIESKTRHIQECYDFYKLKKEELYDLEQENVTEETQLIESIQDITKQFHLRLHILQHFIGKNKWLEFITEHSEYDPSIDQWKIPALEYSMNNLHNKLENEHLMSDSCSSSYRNRPLSSDEISALAEQWEGEEREEDLQRALQLAVESHFDPHTNTETAYLTYGVDVSSIKRKSKSKKAKG